MYTEIVELWQIREADEVLQKDEYKYYSSREEAEKHIAYVGHGWMRYKSIPRKVYGLSSDKGLFLLENKIELS